jgi:spore maturation protein CgeB
MKQHIAFFGSSLVSAYWNGAATYYRGIIRALHQLGYHITFYEPDAFDRQTHRDMMNPAWCDVVVYKANEEADVAPVLEQASSADVIVKASGVGVFDEFLESAVLQIKRPNTLVAFWDVDAPATLDRVTRDATDPFRECIPQYDLIFTYGGGRAVVEAYRLLGARECIPIYNALDPITHYPVPRNSKFESDLAFVGNRLPDREARVEEFFVQAAERLPQHQFLLAGNGWADKPLPENVRSIGHLYTCDHNAFNATPRMVLNVNRESMARYGFSPPTRIFEAAGIGACLITDDWPGIELFLEPDHEVLVAQSGEEVARYVSSVTSQVAQKIGVAARKRILAEHTYGHRAAQLDLILSELATNQPDTQAAAQCGGNI